MLIHTKVREALDNELLEALKVSMPLVIVQLVESIYSLTDTYFVSGLGRDALAAVGITSYLTWLLGVFTAVFQAPLSILASQFIGSGKYKDAARVSGCIISISLLYGFALSILFYVFTDFLVTIQSGARGSMYTYAVDYLRIRSIGYTIMMFSMMLDSIVVASGKTRYSMIAHSTGALINVVLDPVLIYGFYIVPRLEVAGAAYATVIASTIVIPIQLTFLKKINLVPVPHVQGGIIRQALNLGLPVLAERAIMAIGNNAYAGVVARLGETAMAAHNIGLRIESIVYMPGFAFMLAATTLVGHRVGRGDFESAKRVGLKIIYMGSAIMTVVGFIIAMLGYHIVAPFSPSMEVRRLASIYLLLAGLSELGLGLAMVSSGAIRGGGETKIPSAVNAISIFMVRVIPSIIMAKYVGVIGPWIAMFIDVYVRGLFLFSLFKWKFEKLAKKLT
ncbi:MAG: MATE family efflux transporter [Desulfurococcaceae archaeon]